jgi:hypothetical protein
VVLLISGGCVEAGSLSDTHLQQNRMSWHCRNQILFQITRIAPTTLVQLSAVKIVKQGRCHREAVRLMPQILIKQAR